MSVYVTGDTHSTIYLKKILPENLENYKPGDVFIITGDFGLIFSENQSKIEEKYLNLLSNLPYTFCFIDGDRDNYDRLNKYTKIFWNGGRVHQIRNNIYHLLRGNIYNIENKKIFCMGGAETSAKSELNLRRNRLWWIEENISAEDIENGLYYLNKNNFEVDYVITHTCPSCIVDSFKYTEQEIEKMITAERDRAELSNKRASDFNCGQLQYLLDTDIQFKHWYFGHFHVDKKINQKFTCVLNDIIELI